MLEQWRRLGWAAGRKPAETKEISVNELTQIGAEKKVFLFLQMHCSRFGPQLRDALVEAGHTVHKVNFCVGDWLYWRRSGAYTFRKPLNSWSAFLDDFITTHGVTDIVYYADNKPYHRIAARVARRRNINAYCYEFGYLRPDWITLERGAMATLSHFPDTLARVEEISEQIEFDWPEGNYRYPFKAEAFNEVVYHLSTSFGRPLFPYFHHDRYYLPLHEYLSYIPKLFRVNSNNTRANKLIDAMTSSGQKYFVVPMQLQSDYQIRLHSPFDHLSEMLRMVMVSFREHAPNDSNLVIKIHPLDNAIENWPRVARKLAKGFGISNRVQIIDGGDLNRLLYNAEGTIMVNSTVGIHAIQNKCPVKVLGSAIFDMEGLTFQGSLDEFWNNKTLPDEKAVQRFLRVLAKTIQVKGCFYTKEGREAAIPEFVRRLETGDVNAHGAFISPPPRLDRAMASGVAIPPDTGWVKDRPIDA